MIAATAPRFVFDLDDTLYSERDYALSALKFAGAWIDRHLGGSNAAATLVSSFEAGNADAIGALGARLGISQEDKARLIEEMRAHRPDISLRPDSKRLLHRIRVQDLEFSILTDGRSVTQRAKITALGLLDARHIVISEEIGASKPDTVGFERIAAAAPHASYVYVGDNPRKDFLAPNRLGWTTVMLVDRGTNIHPQQGAFEPAYLPHHRIRTLDELGEVLGQEL